jgi:adenylate cyclase
MKPANPLRPVITGAVISALILLGYLLGALDILELKSIDWRFQMRGLLPPRLPIVVVTIDQDSFDELNLPWPWPRKLHADLIEKLTEGNPKAIGVDILFSEAKSDTNEDQSLARAIQKAGNVILAAELTEVESPLGRKLRMNLPLPVLRDQASAYGFVNLVTDQDGIVRRTHARLEYQGIEYPSFAHAIYRLLHGEPKQKRPPHPMLINFHGPAGTFPAVPFYRVLRGEIDPHLFHDKIVMIGAFAASLHDVFSTSFAPMQPMAGVEIQANLLATLLLKEEIRSLPAWAHILLFVVLSVIAIRLSLVDRPYRALVLMILLVVGYGLLNVFLFVHDRLLMPLAPISLAMLFTYGGISVDGYVREFRERVRLRNTFAQYVSPEVVDEILQDPSSIGLGGKRRHITVLFSDIRGFTSLSEQNDPETVVALLSDYLEQVTQIIFNHGGTVDKFIGDAVMAIFGAPKSHGDDALRAVQTGIDMLGLASTLGAKWEPVIGKPLQFGVGINSGDAVVGSIGSKLRSDYTAIGDTVNIAARLEALTKELEAPILISESTFTEVKDSVVLEPLGTVQVVGRRAPLGVFTANGFGAGSHSGAAPTYVQRQK